MNALPFKKKKKKKMKKMKSKMSSRLNQSHLTINLLEIILEKVVITLSMKNPRKGVIPAMKPTKDYRMNSIYHQ